MIDGHAILLYVDGGCRGNRSLDATASIGIYARPGHPESKGFLLSNRFCHKLLLVESGNTHLGAVTNQIAELVALMYGVIKGVSLAQNCGLTGVLIASNSAYACGGIS